MEVLVILGCVALGVVSFTTLAALGARPGWAITGGVLSTGFGLVGVAALVVTGLSCIVGNPGDEQRRFCDGLDAAPEAMWAGYLAMPVVPAALAVLACLLCSRDDGIGILVLIGAIGLGVFGPLLFFEAVRAVLT